MKLTQPWFWGLAVMSLLWLNPSSAWARPPRPPAGELAPRGPGPNHQRQRQEIMSALAQRRYELAQLFQVDEPDRRAIDSKLQEIFELEQRRQHLMVDVFFDARTHMPKPQFERHRAQLIRSLMGKGKLVPERDD